jgi:hypothetical protein
LGSLQGIIFCNRPIKMAHCNPKKRKKNMGSTPHLMN